MTYPINFMVQRGEEFFDGLALNEADAIAQVSAPGGPFDAAEWHNHTAVLTETQGAIRCDTRAEIEAIYSEEISAGYAQPNQVYCGWVIMIQTIEVLADEKP